MGFSVYGCWTSAHSGRIPCLFNGNNSLPCNLFAFVSTRKRKRPPKDRTEKRICVQLFLNGLFIHTRVVTARLEKNTVGCTLKHQRKAWISHIIVSSRQLGGPNCIATYPPSRSTDTGQRRPHNYRRSGMARTCTRWDLLHRMTLQTLRHI